jgi:hypothetical protein
MKAIVFKGKNNVTVEEAPDPRIESADDAVIRIASAAICGSDLHMYEARSAAAPGTVLGTRIPASWNRRVRQYGRSGRASAWCFRSMWLAASASTCARGTN